MSSAKPEKPNPAAAKSAAAPGHPGQSERLAAALRDNLKRRKAQARARQEPPSGRRDG